jgi:hypothetical protein
MESQGSPTNQAKLARSVSAPPCGGWQHHLHNMGTYLVSFVTDMFIGLFVWWSQAVWRFPSGVVALRTTSRLRTKKQQPQC